MGAGVCSLCNARQEALQLRARVAVVKKEEASTLPQPLLRAHAPSCWLGGARAPHQMSGSHSCAWFRHAGHGLRTHVAAVLVSCQS